ncbi:LppX_LprAFG lipoprotein [Streptomyces sp. NPDC001068]|uniref:LppX_LprAFG lipoprotein n=1 Tax=Streptomyces sp. NPDC001068 TaxID=3364544 RepID=UPI0036AB953F
MTRAACVGVLLAGGSAACAATDGKDSTAPSPDSSARRAAVDSTAAAGTDAIAGEQPEAVVAKAARSTGNFTSLRYRIAGTVPSMGHVKGEVSMTTKPWAMNMKVTAEAGTAWHGPMEFRFVKDTIYAGGSALRARRADHKGWISAAPAVWGHGSSQNQAFGLLPNVLEENPIEQPSLLTGSKDLKMVGTETVAGVGTVHYSGTVAKDDVTGDRLDQLIGLEITEPLTMDLWVDGTGHTKQFRLRGTHDEKFFPETGDGPLDLNVTFLDFNKRLTIKAPASADTVSLGDAREG